MAVPVDKPVLEARPAMEDIEAELLLEAIFRAYGNDFRGYDRALMRGRLTGFMSQHGLATISALQDRVLHEAPAAQDLLEALTVGEENGYPDAQAWRSLREVAEPLLRSYAQPRIWLPECSSPELAYSVAIILQEAGVHERTAIYATCSNGALLARARQGAIAQERMEALAQCHAEAGGRQAFSNYCVSAHDGTGFAPDLARNITWAEYNLATDRSFNEFQMIVFRGRLAAFGPELRRRVLALFGNSLAPFGILFTDPVEQLEEPPFASGFRALSRTHGLYRRMTRSELM